MTTIQPTVPSLEEGRGPESKSSLSFNANRLRRLTLAHSANQQSSRRLQERQWNVIRKGSQGSTDSVLVGDSLTPSVAAPSSPPLAPPSSELSVLPSPNLSRLPSLLATTTVPPSSSDFSSSSSTTFRLEHTTDDTPNNTEPMSVPPMQKELRRLCSSPLPTIPRAPVTLQFRSETILPSGRSDKAQREYHHLSKPTSSFKRKTVENNKAGCLFDLARLMDQTCCTQNDDNTNRPLSIHLDEYPVGSISLASTSSEGDSDKTDKATNRSSPEANDAFGEERQKRPRKLQRRQMPVWVLELILVLFVSVCFRCCAISRCDERLAAHWNMAITDPVVVRYRQAIGSGVAATHSWVVQQRLSWWMVLESVVNKSIDNTGLPLQEWAEEACSIYSVFHQFLRRCEGRLWKDANIRRFSDEAHGDPFWTVKTVPTPAHCFPNQTGFLPPRVYGTKTIVFSINPMGHDLLGQDTKQASRNLPPTLPSSLVPVGRDYSTGFPERTDSTAVAVFRPEIGTETKTNARAASDRSLNDYTMVPSAISDRPTRPVNKVNKTDSMKKVRRWAFWKRTSFALLHDALPPISQSNIIEGSSDGNEMSPNPERPVHGARAEPGRNPRDDFFLHVPLAELVGDFIRENRRRRQNTRRKR